MGMRYCTECGERLPDGAKFCGECGTKVERSAPRSDTTHDAPIASDPPPGTRPTTPEEQAAADLAEVTRLAFPHAPGTAAAPVVAAEADSTEPSAIQPIRTGPLPKESPEAQVQAARGRTTQPPPPPPSPEPGRASKIGFYTGKSLLWIWLGIVLSWVINAFSRGLGELLTKALGFALLILIPVGFIASLIGFLIDRENRRMAKRGLIYTAIATGPLVLLLVLMSILLATNR